MTISISARETQHQKMAKKINFFWIGKRSNILERKRSQACSPGAYTGNIQREPEEPIQKEGKNKNLLAHLTS